MAKLILVLWSLIISYANDNEELESYCPGKNVLQGEIDVQKANYQKYGEAAWSLKRAFHILYIPLFDKFIPFLFTVHKPRKIWTILPISAFKITLYVGIYEVCLGSTNNVESNNVS